MRTTITLENTLLLDLQKETGLKSKSRAVLVAVGDYLRRRRVSKVMERAGTYRFHPRTADWRHRDR